MKYLFLLCVSTFIFLRSNAQDQLRVRFGTAIPLQSGKNVGFHTSDGHHKLPMVSGIGLEYYRPLPKKRMGILTGVFVEQQGFTGGLNPMKFTSGSMAGYGSDYGSIKLYGGIEKILNNVKRPNANTFGVFGGVAIGINVLGMDDDILRLSNNPLKTSNGDEYKWVKSRSGFGYTIMTPKTANLFTPELFGGLRWNIKNHQGKTVFVTEGVVNYSLLPKASIEFPYTLNGKPMVDKINDHGFNIQLNALIPVKTFWKKHK